MTDISGTRRTMDDRLFPPREWDTGWVLSMQADKAGYQCTPKERLDHLGDYTAVEVVISGPFPQRVDPGTLGLPDHILEKFTDHSDGPSIGMQMTWEDIEEICDALNRASMNPNAGIPRGTIGWSGLDVFHGTSVEAAEDILAHGIRMDASGLGYFGRAFYVADDRALSVSNYASMADDEAGAVIHACIHDGARILDLRNEKDAEEWAPFANQVGRSDFDIIARKAGIDGVYDRSMGGLAIYNARAIDLIRVEIMNKPEEPSP